MRYPRKGRPFDGDVPGVDDPRWKEWTRPLRAFLGTPRTWDDLRKWASTRRIDGHYLRHQLAWLEDRKLAYSKPPREKKGSWVWFSIEVQKKQPVKHTATLAQKALQHAHRSSKKKIGGEK